jgi:hypothetical protein
MVNSPSTFNDPLLLMVILVDILFYLDAKIIHYPLIL